ncbi:Bax inhibitor-1/YccA family protein [Pedobacter sp. B4-66]|uniref:Bax inhibitor-1/YccA family protein n=1 Tax=Pedobacter sp. B4-66 TaxID=2817280 RepID=UPI001BDA59BC|nr:Bax inhibitor-1/YccA family protein [Pedobacter sp. B4-66]
MDNNNNYDWAQKSVFVQQETGVVAKKFFANVFLWMFVALSVSTAVAFYLATNPELLFNFFSAQTGKPNILGWVVMLSPLAISLIMNGGLNRLSYGAIVGLFILFAALLGISLSSILLVYTSASIISCFAAAAGIFGIMAVMGYTTNVDLSKFGPILMVGVVGLIIASVVNVFIQSQNFSLFMAYIGIAIFTALTAYHVQMLKRIGQGIEESGAQMLDTDSKKLAIIGAMSLYVTFINIFMFLLRIFGNRR